jgi:hypothetical protein
LNQEKISQTLSLVNFGSKGWKSSQNLECPQCHKTGKFAIKFNHDGSSVCHCFKCGTATSLFNYLISIGRNDLIDSYTTVKREEPLLEIDEQKKEEEKTIKEVELPIGFHRSYYEDYLEERGFDEQHYQLFGVGRCTEYKLKNHIIFQIFQNGKLKGWLGRSLMSKEWHKKNLQEFKDGKSSLVLRYHNNEGAEFSELLGGLDEINERTKTVILVEGLFDKTNTDINLYLLDKDEMKCCFTFGNNFSENQAKMLIKKGIRNLILMYDPDAVKQITKFGFKYMNKFKVKVAKLPIVKDEEGNDISKDPGLLNRQECNNIINKLQSPMNYYFTSLQSL